MIFVCPNPKSWDRIYKNLKKAWETKGSLGDPPPIPLILTGWWESNDSQKKERWDSTNSWATKNGLDSLIPESFEEDESHFAKDFAD